MSNKAEHALHDLGSMLFKRKSRLKKASDAIGNVLELVGAINNPQKNLTKQSGRLGKALGLVAVTAPIAWANRDKVKGYVDALLQEGQDRLDLSKQVLRGESPKGSGEEEPQEAEASEEWEEEQPEEQLEEEAEEEKQPVQRRPFASPSKPRKPKPPTRIQQKQHKGLAKRRAA